MDIPVPLLIAMWIWAIGSALSAIAMGVIAIIGLLETLKRTIESDDCYTMAVLLAFFSVIIGFLFFSLSIIYEPTLALWVWRTLSGLSVLCGLAFGMRVLMAPQISAGAVLSLAGATVLGAALLGLGILATSRPLPLISQQIAASSTAAATGSGAFEYSSVAVWHSATLGMLALGTLTFVSLFILASQRGIRIAVETHWGGLGGGFGGWQISQSLGYLIGAIVFGALFGVFILREEGSGITHSRNWTSNPTVAQPDGDSGTEGGPYPGPR